MDDLRDYLATLEAEELRELVAQLTQMITNGEIWACCPNCFSKAISPRLDDGILEWVCLSCENFEAGL